MSQKQLLETLIKHAPDTQISKLLSRYSGWTGGPYGYTMTAAVLRNQLPTMFGQHNERAIRATMAMELAMRQAAVRAPENLTLFRGWIFMPKESKFTVSGFLSTSTDVSIAKHFADQLGDGKSAARIWRILVPKGAWIVPLVQFGQSGEVVLMPGSVLKRVTSERGYPDPFDKSLYGPTYKCTSCSKLKSYLPPKKGGESNFYIQWGEYAIKHKIKKLPSCYHSRTSSKTSSPKSQRSSGSPNPSKRTKTTR